jgi:DNA-binding MarR family transcriptional regulator
LFYWPALSWLRSRHEHVVTQVQLASHTRADVMMTSKVLRSLEKKAYVRRDIHPTDTRAKCVALTKTGREVLFNAIELVEEIDGEFFSALNDQLATFNAQLLALIHQNSDHQ